MKSILVFCSLFISICTSAQKKFIADPVWEFTRNIKLETDAVIPVIHRIIADFDGDGLEDIALSNAESWGNAGGEWNIYFKKREGGYRFYATNTFHPLAYGIKKSKGQNVFISYSRDNCCSGRMSYEKITPHGFKLLKIDSIGEKEKLSGEEVATKIDNKLKDCKTGIWQTVNLGCLRQHKNNCWSKNLYLH